MPLTERSALNSYLAPIIAFGVFTAAESWVPPGWYPLAYAIKILAVLAAFARYRGSLADIQPAWRFVLPSVVLGVVVLVAWVGIDTYVWYPHIGDRTGFNPLEIESSSARVAFLAARFIGLVLVVPVMEELLWRSFLLRYLTNADAFLTVPIGTFSVVAFVGMVVASSLAHPEWLVAVIASAAYGWWVRQTKSIFAAVVAHATTNAGLGWYILVTRDWKYW